MQALHPIARRTTGCCLTPGWLHTRATHLHVARAAHLHLCLRYLLQHARTS
jgi:hypothetical protein